MIKLNRKSVNFLKMLGLIGILVLVVVAVGCGTGKAFTTGTGGILFRPVSGITNVDLQPNQAIFDLGNGVMLVKKGDFKAQSDLLRKASINTRATTLSNLYNQVAVEAQIRMDNFAVGCMVPESCGGGAAN